jgi:hypothetical protein
MLKKCKVANWSFGEKIDADVAAKRSSAAKRAFVVMRGSMKPVSDGRLTM